MLVETRTKKLLSLVEIAQDTSKLRKVWEKVTGETCPYQYNFHLFVCNYFSTFIQSRSILLFSV